MQGSEIIKTISTQHAYVLAEELAFCEIENEFGVSVRRQDAVGGDYHIDGIFLQQGKPVAIEIKYTKGLPYTIRIMRRELHRFSRIAQSMKPEPSFLLAIVVEGLNEKQKKLELSRLMKMVEEDNLSVQIRIFDFHNLKEKYGFSYTETRQGTLPNLKYLSSFLRN